MAPKKRGMSLEEKRTVIQSIFHDSKSVFVLKDIEKMAVKKGVVAQSVKDVLQSLVDDDLVHQDKIGISNFFWSFPSEVAVRLEKEESTLNSKLEGLSKEQDTLVGKIEEEREGKEDSKERRELAESISKMKGSIGAKRKELETYSENDPERFENLRKIKVTCRDGANRWTDNIFSMQSWMKKKFVGMDAQMKQFFVQQGVSEDMDYLE